MPHRLFVLLFGILFMGLLPGSARQSPDKIWHKLDSIQNYRTEFTYTVTLPLTDSEINYRAELSYRKNPIDTLCGYSYLIDYKAENDTCPYANLWLTTTAITSGSTVIGYENIIIAKTKNRSHIKVTIREYTVRDCSPNFSRLKYPDN